MSSSDLTNAHRKSIATPEIISCGQNIFVLHDGRARIVPNTDVLNQLTHLGPAREVENSVISSAKFGPQIPDVQYPNDPTELDFERFREYFGRDLLGNGVEFGAGPRPFIIPTSCSVRYADIFNAAEFVDKSTSMMEVSPETRFVDIDLQDSMDSMLALENESVDFIIGSHVIEHVKSPLLVIKNAYEKLRNDGQLLLVIPDRDRTFDKGRPLTSFSHHLADYYLPSRDRDFEHFVEFSRLVLHVSVGDLETHARNLWNERKDIHYHTFTPDQFREIGQWAINVIGFSRFELHDGRLREPSLEFYVKLKK